MSHSFPCSPQGGKISQLNPMHLLYRQNYTRWDIRMHSCMQFIKRSHTFYCKLRKSLYQVLQVTCAAAERALKLKVKSFST